MSWGAACAYGAAFAAACVVLTLINGELKIGLSQPWLMTTITRETHPLGFLVAILVLSALSLGLALGAAFSLLKIN